MKKSLLNDRVNGVGAQSRGEEEEDEREPRLDFEGGMVISFMLFHVDVSLERRERKREKERG